MRINECNHLITEKYLHMEHQKKEEIKVKILIHKKHRKNIDNT